MHDYLDEHAIFQGYYFHRWLWMHTDLFMHIVEGVSSVSEYMRQRSDARGTLGFNPIKKCTSVFHMLVYATPPDALDESFRMSGRTIRKNLHEFCILVLSLHGPQYLHHPTSSDIQMLYAHHVNVHGLHTMLGCLDYMHWRWNLCPNAYHGNYTKGNYHYSTVVLEAAASRDLWFCHA